MTSPFPIDPQMTAIAVIVRNPAMIADQVLPRTSPLAKTQFAYQYYPPAQQFTVPDTKVGRRSQVNQVEFNGKRMTAEPERPHVGRHHHHGGQQPAIRPTDRGSASGGVRLHPGPEAWSA